LFRHCPENLDAEVLKACHWMIKHRPRATEASNIKHPARSDHDLSFGRLSVRL
jgi:hypothetical protein